LQQLSAGLEQASKNIKAAQIKHGDSFAKEILNKGALREKFPNLFELHTNQEDTMTTAKPYTYDDFIANNPFREKVSIDPKDELIARLQQKAKNRKAELKKLNKTILETKAISQSRLERLQNAEVDLRDSNLAADKAELNLAQSEGIKNVLDQRVRTLITEKDAITRANSATVFRLEQQLRTLQANHRDALQILAKTRHKLAKRDKKIAKLQRAASNEA
jgi:hypothetical protein